MVIGPPALTRRAGGAAARAAVHRARRGLRPRGGRPRPRPGRARRPAPRRHGDPRPAPGALARPGARPRRAGRGAGASPGRRPTSARLLAAVLRDPAALVVALPPLSGDPARDREALLRAPASARRGGGAAGLPLGLPAGGAARGRASRSARPRAPTSRSGWSRARRRRRPATSRRCRGPASRAAAAPSGSRAGAPLPPPDLVLPWGGDPGAGDPRRAAGAELAAALAACRFRDAAWFPALAAALAAADDPAGRRRRGRRRRRRPRRRSWCADAAWSRDTAARRSPRRRCASPGSSSATAAPGGSSGRCRTAPPRSGRATSCSSPACATSAPRHAGLRRLLPPARGRALPRRRQRLDRRLHGLGRGPARRLGLAHRRRATATAAFGMLWVNDLLRRHGRGRWCVVVDPDEFLVYPMHGDPLAARRSAQFLEDDQRPCLHALLVDAYSDRPLAETRARRGRRPVRGLPVLRPRRLPAARGLGQLHLGAGRPAACGRISPTAPTQAPALNKIPLRALEAALPLQHVDPRRLAAAAEPGACPGRGLDHRARSSTSSWSAALRDKAAEEAVRGEHYAGGPRVRPLPRAAAAEFYAEGLSVRYEGSGQLVALGLMSPGPLVLSAAPGRAAARSRMALVSQARSAIGVAPRLRSESSRSAAGGQGASVRRHPLPSGANVWSACVVWDFSVLDNLI